MLVCHNDALKSTSHIKKIIFLFKIVIKIDSFDILGIYVVICKGTSDVNEYKLTFHTKCQGISKLI